MFPKPIARYKSKVWILSIIVGSLVLNGCTPKINSFTPIRGPVGTRVSIEGENFVSVEYIQFGQGKSEDFEISGFLQFKEINATVPQDATTGKIKVKTGFYMQPAESADAFDVETNKWAKTYGGEGMDYACAFHQTRDGGCIAAGLTTSFGADSSDVDIWVLKLDGSGDIVWQKTYGRSGFDVAFSIHQTTDMGYIVVGTTLFEPGSRDTWVLKLDPGGNIVWQKTHGGPTDHFAWDIHQTADECYIVAGGTDFGTGFSAFYVMKLNTDGDIVWQKTYGGAYLDIARTIHHTIDGGYIVAGRTNSFGSGSDDIWILKLDPGGNVLWQKTYGGSGSDYTRSIYQTSDEGYIVAGYTNSFGAGSDDFWILKLDQNGNIIWQRTYGGSESDIPHSIRQTIDEGYIVAGGGDFGAGAIDIWILKLEANGDIAWQKTYGGSGTDYASSIRQNMDGGYIVSGYTNSYGSGYYDFWVLKLDGGGDITGSCGQDTSVVPADTSVVPQDTSATVTTPSPTVDSTTVTPADTDAVIETQCTDE